MVVWIEEEAYLTALEVCALLSVKPQTLYAYVSRGVLHSYRQGKRRQRLYLLREGESLLRLRPPPPPGSAAPLRRGARSPPSPSRPRRPPALRRSPGRPGTRTRPISSRRAARRRGPAARPRSGPPPGALR